MNDQEQVRKTRLLGVRATTTEWDAIQAALADAWDEGRNESPDRGGNDTDNPYRKD